MLRCCPNILQRRRDVFFEEPLYVPVDLLMEACRFMPRVWLCGVMQRVCKTWYLRVNSEFGQFPLLLLPSIHLEKKKRKTPFVSIRGHWDRYEWKALTLKCRQLSRPPPSWLRFEFLIIRNEVTTSGETLRKHLPTLSRLRSAFSDPCVNRIFYKRSKAIAYRGDLINKLLEPLFAALGGCPHSVKLVGEGLPVSTRAQEEKIRPLLDVLSDCRQLDLYIGPENRELFVLPEHVLVSFDDVVAWLHPPMTSYSGAQQANSHVGNELASSSPGSSSSRLEGKQFAVHKLIRLNAMCLGCSLVAYTNVYTINQLSAKIQQVFEYERVARHFSLYIAAYNIWEELREFCVVNATTRECLCGHFVRQPYNNDNIEWVHCRFEIHRCGTAADTTHGACPTVLLEGLDTDERTHLDLLHSQRKVVQPK